MATVDLNLPADAETLVQQGLTLAIDKPLGMTSFHVVRRMRGAFQRRYNLKKLKIGHAGTLDPLATGVLVLCVGRATKGIQQYVDSEKGYQALLTLGAITASYDAESDIEPTGSAIPELTDELRLALIEQFSGLISQKPPIFSAVKIEGKRAYHLARKGVAVDIKAREVVIHALSIQAIQPDVWQLDIQCSKGTYIRSLAHDMGQSLGCGAYLSGLVRTQVGSHHLHACHDLDAAWEAVHPGHISEE
ncbi:MAG: tRNA pseudouridine(55) synthase TruB [Schleiferiaceae bacterium]|jgi:tRNA pseudouridine55 synthase|nr:tRNA pseudouridine(55) synthase TruB [Flavobacteriales bacterium]MDG1005523.1 tRNA pseudouridine(55) synthase TruB [Schleiferiaceae bacterium]MDG1757720.1 tRNA pseudouridine(55) synthase TruB [Schleiferiaceae bacterium]MDG2225786.1 tRNA pseudouridine(55) synthase TruB [Schleiferiaceae bacterium]MDO7566398.1 tRNA pseudouridine(55) synthase TruB [Schleiferiaceae bacterium]